MSRHRIGGALAGTVPALFAAASASRAQLLDETQIAPNVPGGQIGKSLEEQVGEGHGDELTPGSAVYLIKRDPGRSCATAARPSRRATPSPHSRPTTSGRSSSSSTQ